MVEHPVQTFYILFHVVVVVVVVLVVIVIQSFSWSSIQSKPVATSAGRRPVSLEIAETWSGMRRPSTTAANSLLGYSSSTATGDNSSGGSRRNQLVSGNSASENPGCASGGPAEGSTGGSGVDARGGESGTDSDLAKSTLAVSARGGAKTDSVLSIFDFAKPSNFFFESEAFSLIRALIDTSPSNFST